MAGPSEWGGLSVRVSFRTGLAGTDAKILAPPPPLFVECRGVVKNSSRCVRHAASIGVRVSWQNARFLFFARHPFHSLRGLFGSHRLRTGKTTVLSANHRFKYFHSQGVRSVYGDIKQNAFEIRRIKLVSSFGCRRPKRRNRYSQDVGDCFIVIRPLIAWRCH